MYSVETDIDAISDVEALPSEALTAYAELITALQVVPLSGQLLNPRRSSANMRSQTFGPHGRGLAVYYVLEDQRRVVVLCVMWLD